MPLLEAQVGLVTGGGRGIGTPPSKAALTRFTEMPAAQGEPHGVPAFAVAPGIVRSQMTASLPDTIWWAPPDAPARLIRGIAEGNADDVAEIRERDLNAIRLRR
jgi:NAD(P)-dependent dehydrogenase (short-subunit alcohol dehydrogenase family)